MSFDKLNEARRKMAYARGLPGEKDAEADAVLSEVESLLGGVAEELTRLERLVLRYGPWFGSAIKWVVIVLWFVISLATPAAGLWWYGSGGFDRYIQEHVQHGIEKSTKGGE